MLTYDVKDHKGSTVVYSYVFEGDASAPGTVELNIDSGEISVLQLAGNDRHSRAAAHLIAELGDSHRNGVLKDSGMVAWH